MYLALYFVLCIAAVSLLRQQQLRLIKYFRVCAAFTVVRNVVALLCVKI